MKTSNRYSKFLLLKRILLLILLSDIPALNGFPSVVDTTSIVIVGTVHSPTAKFTADSLLNIINRVKPDLILIELDSSFFTPSMSVKPQFRNISLETRVISDYHEKNNVNIRPYDIEGRNRIYNETHYFDDEDNLSKAMRQAVRDSLVKGESWFIYDAIGRFDRISRAFGSDYPIILNSGACSAAMDSKQYYANEGMVRMVSAVPVLNRFIKFATFKRDFWIRRNDTMVNKILGWNKTLHPATILVVCGYEHKYYISRSLAEKQEDNNFKLREYWSIR